MATPVSIVVIGTDRSTAQGAATDLNTAVAAQIATIKQLANYVPDTIQVIPLAPFEDQGQLFTYSSCINYFVY